MGLQAHQAGLKLLQLISTQLALQQTRPQLVRDVGPAPDKAALLAKYLP